MKNRILDYAQTHWNLLVIVNFLFMLGNVLWILACLMDMYITSFTIPFRVFTVVTMLVLMPSWFVSWVYHGIEDRRKAEKLLLQESFNDVK